MWCCPLILGSRYRTYEDVLGLNLRDLVSSRRSSIPGHWTRSPRNSLAGPVSWGSASLPKPGYRKCSRSCEHLLFVLGQARCGAPPVTNERPDLWCMCAQTSRQFFDETQTVEMDGRDSHGDKGFWALIMYLLFVVLPMSPSSERAGERRGESDGRA